MSTKRKLRSLCFQDEKLAGCHIDIARPGESVRITPVKDVIEPRVKVSGGDIFPGVIGKVSPQGGNRQDPCAGRLLRGDRG